MNTDSALHWQCLRFPELTVDQLYDLLKLRAEIFVVEQNCPYCDLDDKDRDPQTRHLLGLEPDSGLVAYSRLLRPGLSFEEPSFGRVVTCAARRGQGLGHPLVAQSVQQTEALWPLGRIRIGAQSHLQALYQRHGFQPDSEEYLEDGIPHREMLRHL